jgi:putative transposase
MEPTNQGEVPKLSQVIQIDEGKIQEHLGEVVRSTVEETLNAMLDAEADRLCRAERYERTEARKDTRAGSYQRQLQTKAGEVTLKVPKLRTLPLETAIIERYRRRESSVEEALVEMYLAGVSVRRVEDITEALWGTRVSPSTVSELNQKIYAQIESWRNRAIEGKHPYVFLDGLWLKRSWGGEVRNVSLLVAIGVNEEGFSRSTGGGGRIERRQSQLDSIFAALERTRTRRHPAVCFRQVFGTGREPGRALSGSDVAALHGAFLS